MSTGSSTVERPEATAVRRERVVDVGGAVVLFALAVGWIWSIVNARPLGASTLGNSAAGTIAADLTHAHVTSTAYLTDAALEAAANRAGANPPPAAGPAARAIMRLSALAMLPFSAKQNGHIGTYFLGSWPSEHGARGPAKAPPGAYGNPAGFIEVTAANRDTPISPHFKLGDFVTHDQPNVWPKYIVLQQRLVDKLELVLADLQAHGYDVHGVHIMSGFRSPQYNYTGGNTAGRANLSRHMYGDASDIYIDDDGDGQMDDLNHDGKISIDDARVIAQSVDRVEAAHPELVGGAGVYTAAPGHGPFIHIDARGYRARWSGTSGG